MLVSIAVPKPIRKGFIYSASAGQSISVGSRVRVPFANQSLIGVVIDKGIKPREEIVKIREVIEVLDAEGNLPPEIVSLCKWAAEYYHHPVGEVFMNALPRLLRTRNAGDTIFREKKLAATSLGLSIDPGIFQKSPKKIKLLMLIRSGKQTKKELDVNEIKPHLISSFIKSGWALWEKSQRKLPEEKNNPIVSYQGISLNEDQEKVLLELKNTKSKRPFLLHGITGSGKTEIYLRTIEKSLLQGKQALVLVPEIGLTPQLVSRFEERFSLPVSVINSTLTDKERATAWLNSKTGIAKIILGTRSAIFTPFKDLGIIVVDEEHDLSYKQQDGFRYSARDIAIYRAHVARIPIILGSATPSLESFYNSETGRYKKLFLGARPPGRQPETYSFIDTSKLLLNEGLTKIAENSIRKTIESGEQALLFINQRGFCPIIMCGDCKWVAHCEKCNAKLTYHKIANIISCHHCGEIKNAPRQCNSCKGSKLLKLGIGTQRLEESAKTLFPDTEVVRIDSDALKKKNSMKTALERIQENKPRILIGTQILAKGHDFPNITLVVIVNSDIGFYSSDYRALERIGQIILQVGGRAGRGKKPGRVLIQTEFGSQEILKKLTTNGYSDFAKHLLKERNEASLPPYRYEAAIHSECEDLQVAKDFLADIVKVIPTSKEVSLLGPIPGIIEKKNSRYRQILIVTSQNRKNVHGKLREIETLLEKTKTPKNLKWFMDIDPINMM